MAYLSINRSGQVAGLGNPFLIAAIIAQQQQQQAAAAEQARQEALVKKAQSDADAAAAPVLKQITDLEQRKSSMSSGQLIGSAADLKGLADRFTQSIKSLGARPADPYQARIWDYRIKSYQSIASRSRSLADALQIAGLQKQQAEQSAAQAARERAVADAEQKVLAEAVKRNAELEAQAAKTREAAALLAQEAARVTAERERVAADAAQNAQAQQRAREAEALAAQAAQRAAEASLAQEQAQAQSVAITQAARAQQVQAEAASDKTKLIVAGGVAAAALAAGVYFLGD
jgi:hypothetical protein